MKIGFYPGSFDPFTNGHLAVINQTTQLFDIVIVGIGTNPLKIFKRRRFKRKLMKEAMERVFKREKLDNIIVITYNDFFLRVALKYNSTMLIRGIRNKKDYDYETTIAKIYKRTTGLDTMYIYGENISSTMVIEKIKNGKNVEKYIPKEIMEVVLASGKNY